MGKTTNTTEIEKPWYKKIVSFVVGILFTATFISFIAFGIWKWLFLIVPVLIILNKIFFPSNKSKFLKVQGILPASKANAIAMGMVEIVGDLEEIEPLISPYFSKECIGYFYRIEKESKPDDEGRTTYHTIHFEQKIGVFNILDETGFVQVNGTDLEFYNKSADRYEGGKTRHSEGYLLHNDYMMLIGYASSNEGKTIIKKEDKNIFIIANPSNIENYNQNLPLLNAFLTTLFIATLLILFILLN
ncbi:MAG TPA: hypothetical protein VF677_12845 [Flavobacterium sp.]|jgi:hypothetical protein